MNDAVLLFIAIKCDVKSKLYACPGLTLSDSREMIILSIFVTYLNALKTPVL